MLNISEDSLYFIVLMISALFLVFLGFFFAFIELYRRRQLQFRSNQKQREQAYQEELMRTQLEIREQVMRQISEELHDNVGQSLLVAKMQLNSISNTESTDQFQTINELISRSIKTIRNISKSLNGDYILREGLMKAIHKEAANIASSGQVSCNITGEIPVHFLTPNSEVLVFRCIQETLSNAIKHSQASRINIDLNTKSHILTICVSDNGVGLPENWKAQRGLGMDNLIRRVNMIDGHVNISSKPGEGTKISINLHQKKHPDELIA